MKTAAKLLAIAMGVTISLFDLKPTEAAAIKIAPTVTHESNVANVHRRRYYHRHGYRRGYRNGAAIAGAIIGGAIIAGAIVRENRRRRSYRRGGSHVNWCYNRYRSYRAYDNTFQPYRGGRRYCRSPYR